MARKDDIFNSFIKHKILEEKYNLDPNKLPALVKDGLKSDIPIIKAIATIVENLESSSSVTDKLLHTTITQLLNTTAI